MTFIVEVRWGYNLDRPDLTKSYEVEADSPNGAIQQFKKEWGYNPGVPMRAREKGVSAQGAAA